MKPSLLRRALDHSVLFVALLAVVAAAIAWVMVRDEPRNHARQLAFVIKPSPDLDASQVPDAVRGISQVSSELVFTIARVIETEPFRRPPGTALGSGYAIDASVPPATNVVHVRVQGPDADVLRRFEPGYAELAARWVRRTYPAYRLEFLEGKVAPDPTRRSVLERIGLAGMLGLLFGLLVVFADRKPAWREAPAGDEHGDGPPPGPGPGSPPPPAVALRNGHATSSRPPSKHGAARRSPRV